jgi:hypothetical protein
MIRVQNVHRPSEREGVIFTSAMIGYEFIAGTARRKSERYGYVNG